MPVGSTLSGFGLCETGRCRPEELFEVTAAEVRREVMTGRLWIIVGNLLADFVSGLYFGRTSYMMLRLARPRVFWMAAAAACFTTPT
jgi:hypothetical protein